MNKKKSFTLGKDRATQFQLHTLMLPGTICIILFSILPLFGLILAFKNYSVVEGVAGILQASGMDSRILKLFLETTILPEC